MDQIRELAYQNGEFITQLVTFVLFFWILKINAWKPLLNLVDQRTQKIEDGFADIRRRQAQADKLHAEYAERLKGIEAEARQKIQDAVADGRRVAAEVLDNARAEAEQIKAAAQRSIQVELANARVALRDELVGMTIGATERLLRERLNADEQRRLVGSFIDELERRN